MQLQASLLQLLALGLLMASTIALGQKIFELYYEEEEKTKNLSKKWANLISTAKLVNEKTTKVMPDIKVNNFFIVVLLIRLRLLVYFFNS